MKPGVRKKTPEDGGSTLESQATAEKGRGRADTAESHGENCHCVSWPPELKVPINRPDAVVLHRAQLGERVSTYLNTLENG